MAYSPTAFAYSGDLQIVPEGTEQIQLQESFFSQRFVCTGVIDEYNTFYGLDYDSSTDTYSFSSNPRSGPLEVVYDGVIAVTFKYTGIGNSYSYCFGRSYESFNVQASLPSASGIRFLCENVEVGCNNTIYAAPVFKNQQSSYCLIQSSTAWYNMNTAVDPITITYTCNCKVIARFNGVADTDVSELIATCTSVAPTGAVVYGSQECYANRGEYSLLEIADIFETKLYNIWVTDNLIYHELVWNSQTPNFSTQLSGQLAQEASQAHSDALTLDNHLLYDSSGSSQNSSTINTAYNTANAAADQAVDAAVPSYEAKLDEVENYDFSSFFTSQNSAVTFWRDVGEFILDSSNLGYIASGLIIVTIIGLFVYLLRL